MKSHLKYSLFMVVVLLFTACTKDINLNMPQPPQQIVVEGHIEPGENAYLYLSHNFAFFGTTTINGILQADVVHGAKIAISDGYTTDSMKEVIPMLGYYMSTSMKGVTARTYTLNVTANGQTVTSSTTILPAVPLDSVWFKVDPGMDSLGYLWANLHDPPQPGNCYRWLAMRIGKDTTYIPPRESVFNDVLINGQTFQFFYERGIFPGSKAQDDTDIERHYFKKGDKVVVKFCSIDNASYQFYNEYYFQLGNSGNPFGSPAPLQGNINGGLGIWCAYGTYLDTVICK